MFISQKLRKENIAEYLLYMWQIEDLLRACNMDIDIVREKYLSRFSELSPTQQKEQEHYSVNTGRYRKRDQRMQNFTKEREKYDDGKLFK